MIIILIEKEYNFLGVKFLQIWGEHSDSKYLPLVEQGANLRVTTVQSVIDLISVPPRRQQ